MKEPTVSDLFSVLWKDFKCLFNKHDFNLRSLLTSKGSHIECKHCGYRIYLVDKNGDKL